MAYYNMHNLFVVYTFKTTSVYVYRTIFPSAVAYTYYRSLCQEESLRWRGKQGDRKMIRRRRERLVRVS